MMISNGKANVVLFGEKQGWILTGKKPGMRRNGSLVFL